MKLPRFFVGKNKADTNRNSLKVPPENVLSLRKKDDFKIEINITQLRTFLISHKKLASPIGILILVVIIFSIALKGKASIVNFYPETCLGGWENPSNASGQPSVSSEAQGSDFTRDNSAFLKNRTAQLFCGDFGGEVPEDSVPRKFTVRFSWFVDDGSYDKGEKIINKALDEGRVFNQHSITDIVPVTNEENENSSTGGGSGSGNTDEVIDDTPVPSNEGQHSDLPSGEFPSDAPVNTDTETPSSEESVSSDENKESAPTEKSTEGSSSDSGNSDSGSDSSGGESGGDSGAGAFLKRFAKKVFAQESEESASPAETTSTEAPSDEPAETKEPEIETIEVQEPEVEVKNEEIIKDEPASTDEDTEKENNPSQEGVVEDGSTDTENQDTPSTTDFESDSSSEDDESELPTTDDSARDDLFRITYTTDGSNWEELGVVKRNDWKNVEFEIPFSAVDSWEKLSKVQIAIESLPTIDQFPEAYLDSTWITVEYEGVNPDPIPQPDFLTDKVLDDIRYENIRAIKIMKPDGQFQIWYAFIPESLLGVVNADVGSDEIIQSGDSGLQVIDVSSLDSYDPLIGPQPQDLSIETTVKDTRPTDVKDTAQTETIISPEEKKESTEQPSSPEVLGESLDVPSEEAQETFDEKEVLDGEKEKLEEKSSPITTLEKPSSLDSIFDFMSTSKDEKSSEEKDALFQETQALNEKIIKKEGETTDLQDLNQPEWYWNLIAEGVDVHPLYGISIDNFKLFWINAEANSINLFGLDTSGSYSGAYFDLSQNVGAMIFMTPSGTSRFARFNRETTQFIFSDE